MLVFLQEIVVRYPKDLHEMSLSLFGPCQKNKIRYIRRRSRTYGPAFPSTGVSTVLSHRSMHQSTLFCPKGSCMWLGYVCSCAKGWAHLNRSRRWPSISLASMIEYEWFSDMPFRSLGGPLYLGSSQLEYRPVPQPKRKSLLTFISSSLQNRSLSRMLLDNISDVTPPVRSSMASLQHVNIWPGQSVRVKTLPYEPAFNGGVIAMGFGVCFL